MSGNYNNTGFPAPASPITAEQAEKNFAKTQAESMKNLVASTNVTVEKDDKGQSHHYWMGMEVSEEMLPFFQYFASVAPQFINDFLKKGVYENSKKIAERVIEEFKINASKEAGHNAGLAGAAIVSGLLIGLQPISEIGQAVRLRNKKRTEIYRSLEDVIATNSDYKHNEVIQTALERSNKIFSDGLSRAMAELPTVAVNAAYAYGSHKELAAEKNTEFKVKQELAGNKIGSHSKEAEDLIKLNKELEKEKSAFFRKHAGDDTESKKYKDAESAWAEVERKRKLEAREKLKAEAAGKTGEKAKETNLEMKMLGINAAAVLTQSLKSKLKKEVSEASKELTAYEQIIKLQAKFDNGDIREGTNITKQIIDIFQANEKDRGRAHIGPVLVAKFEPLAKRIAKVISDGELSPLALVNLVGDGQVMNHRRFVSEEELEQIIDRQRSVFAGRDKTSFEDMLADFKAPEQIVAVLKDNFKELKGRERAMVAALLPYDVLINMGFKPEEAKAEQRMGHDQLYEFAKKEILIIAQEPEEKLEKLELSKEQISALKEASEKIEKGEEKDIRKIIEGSKDDKNNIVVSTIRKVILEEQIAGQEKPKNFWTAKIAAKPPVKKPAEIIAERGDEQDLLNTEKLHRNKNHSHHSSQGSEARLQ